MAGKTQHQEELFMQFAKQEKVIISLADFDLTSIPPAIKEMFFSSEGAVSRGQFLQLSILFFEGTEHSVKKHVGVRPLVSQPHLHSQTPNKGGGCSTAE